MVSDHVGNVQVFNGDNGVAINVPLRRIVQKVFALTSNLEVTLGNVACGLLSSAGALLTTRELTLCPSELLLRLPVAAWVLDRLATRICEKDLEANVEANGGTVSFIRCVSEITDNKHVPMPIGPQNEVSALGSTFERPVLLDLDPS